VWAEHQVCVYWGQNTDRMTISNFDIPMNGFGAYPPTVISGAPIGIWANEYGPAAGEASFTNTRFSNNGTDVRNTTSTFRLNLG
jgi:hypothetical protein